MRQISFEDGITYVFGPHLEPVATVRSGETVEFVCQDSCGGQIRSEEDTLDHLQMDRVNGATGPVAIEGTHPGDAIRVRIRDIRVAATGFQSIVSSYGVLGQEVRGSRTKMIPIRDGKAVFSKGIRLPIRPHVGTIGVAPASQEWTTFYPRDHGGNLDTKEITKGNSVYLQVFQPVGQLALGDLHALMPDGEVAVPGVQIAGTDRPRRERSRRGEINATRTRGDWSPPETLLGPRSFVASPLQEAAFAARTAGGDVPWRTSIRSRPSRSCSRRRSLASSRSPWNSP